MHHPMKCGSLNCVLRDYFVGVLAAVYVGLVSTTVLAQSDSAIAKVAVPKATIVVANPEPREVTFSFDLDLGISIASEVPVQSGTKAEASFRKTEAQLLAAKQRSVFEESGQWGVVRLYPEPSVIPELMLELTVLQSDGRELLITARAIDVSGNILLHETYLDSSASDHIASNYSYAQRSNGSRLAPVVDEPFVDLFHRIHRDVAKAVYEHARSPRYLDTLSFLRYAQQLAPSAFSGYVDFADGQWRLLREPSKRDPMYARIAKLRDYELLFVDTIDEQLSGALREIDVAYRLWLRASKEQLDWLERRRARGLDPKGFTDDSAFARHQAVYAAYRSLKIHEQELFELVLDLESESRSTALEIEDNVVKLEGTLAEQYREWRETLLKIIRLENTL